MAPSLDRPDVVIRGGTVVDGTGGPAFVGDVAVKGDKIVAVGQRLAVSGIEEFNAAGLLVTPGWIDAHTHLDAQWSWDPYLTPSSAAGVTTCVMGNCGIGFAPCQEDRRQFLAHLVEAVEDIPGGVIAEGLQYDFETFEEFLESIDRKNLACDLAVLVGHCAVRTWVMGRRANLSDRPRGSTEHPVLPHEIEAIAALVRDAVAAGAFGFSTSRLLIHRDPEGTLTPGALAGYDELHAICDAIAEGGGGIFQMSSDFQTYDDFGSYAHRDPKRAQEFGHSEFEWMRGVVARHGPKVAFTFNVGKPLIPFLESLSASGGVIKGQHPARPQGFLHTFGSRLHIFIVSKSYQKAAKRCQGSQEALLAELRKPALRAKVLGEAGVFFAKDHKMGLGELANIFLPFSRVYLWTPGYEPTTGTDDIKSISLREGRSPLEVAYDHMLEGGVLWKPLAGYDKGSLEQSDEVLRHQHAIPGFADAGAHGTAFQDAAAATFMLTHWVRDRSRGPKMGLEAVVRKNTSEIAKLFGLKDRGVLAPGYLADLNVLDLEKAKMCKPYLARDLPLGQQRWMQDVEGYQLTLKSGKPTYRSGVATGELPGRLVRNPCSNKAAWRGISASVSGPFESGLMIPTDANSQQRALEGSGSAGASAAARVVRSTLEGGLAAAPLRSRL